LRKIFSKSIPSHLPFAILFLKEKEERTEGEAKEMEKNPSVNWNSRKMVRQRRSYRIIGLQRMNHNPSHSYHTYLVSIILGQEYAQVVRMLGNGRCECFCYDGVTRLGHIRGKMRKKVWITAGDIILAAKRDFQDEKVDIVHKYTADEARNLKQYGELPENARINETAVDMAMAEANDDDDIGIAFDDI
jgi:translation initiation factor 1A